MGDLTYRAMTDGDINAVIRLHADLAVFIKEQTGDDYFDFELVPEADLHEQLRKSLGEETAAVYVAEDGGGIAGFAAGEIQDCFLPFSRTKKIGYISGAYIKPEYRNRGVMKGLERILLEFFRSHGVSYAELHVISNNLTAKKAWEALGYRTFREQMRKRID